MDTAVGTSERVALVTGGTFGIGRATALGLARQGFRVVISGRDAERTQDAVQSLQRESGNEKISFLLADFFDTRQVQALAQTFTEQHDRLYGFRPIRSKNGTPPFLELLSRQPFFPAPSSRVNSYFITD